jgi:hypothetical protein
LKKYFIIIYLYLKSESYNNSVSHLSSDQVGDAIGDEDDLNSRSQLLFTPNTYTKQKDEFYDGKKKNMKLYLVKARRCDQPYDVIFGDKRRTLNALFSEIQVLLLLLFYF